jgi:hypothetical protein
MGCNPTGRESLPLADRLRQIGEDAGRNGFGERFDGVYLEAIHAVFFGQILDKETNDGTRFFIGIKRRASKLRAA